MKTYSTEEVIAHIKEKQAGSPKPKMVYEIDYRRMERKAAKDKKRLEACIDSVLLELKGVKEALDFLEFTNEENEKKIQNQRNKLAAYTPVVKAQIDLYTTPTDETSLAADKAIKELMEKLK